MAVNASFPAFLSVEYQDTGGFSAFNSALAKSLTDGEAKTRAFGKTFDAVQQTLRSAGRNDAGVLQVDVSGARSAAQALQAQARDARELAGAMASLAASERDESTSSRLAVAAAQATAREHEDAAQAAVRRVGAMEQLQRHLESVALAEGRVITATRSTTSASQGHVASAGSQRSAMVQLGQQFQDVAVQAQMGTSAFTIFAQQGGQVGYALSGMKGKLGEVGTFIAGPWGIALTLGVVAAGKLYDAMNKVADASDLAKIGANGLSDAQSVLGGVFDMTSGKVKSQNELLIANARLTAINLRSEALAEKTSSKKAFGQAGKVDPLLIPLNRLLTLDRGRSLNEYLGKGDTQAELVKRYQSGKISGPDALRVAEKLDFKGLKVERDKFLQAFIDDLSADAKKLVADKIDKSLDTGVLAGGLRESGRKTGAEKPRPMTLAEVRSILLQEFPGIGITSGARSPSSALGKKNPNSYHNFGQALDFTRTPGLTIDTVRERLLSRGVNVKEALDEYAHPSKNATGPHYHVAFDKDRISGEQGAEASRRLADEAQQAAEKHAADLARTVEQATGKITSLNGQFEEQPTLIERSARAVADLRAEIAGLAEARAAGTPGADATAQAAERAIEAARQAVPKAITRDVEADERSYQLQLLRSAGLEHEADLREKIAAAEDRYGFDKKLGELQDALVVQEASLTAAESGSDAQKAATAAVAATRAEMQRVLGDQRLSNDQINAQIAGEEDLIRLRQQSEEVLRRQGQVIGTLRGELEALFAGEGDGQFFANLSRSFNRFRGEVLTEQIFGPALKELEQFSQRNTPLGRATAGLQTASEKTETSFISLARAAEAATNGLTGTAANDNGLPVGGVLGAAGLSGFGAIAQAGLAIARQGPFGGGIGAGVVNDPGVVITAQRPAGGVGEIEGFARATSQTVADPIIKKLDELLGTTFFTRMGETFRGGIEGFLRAGPVGGLLGAVRGLPGLPKEIANKLTVALDGAETGYQAALIGKSLGIKTSSGGGALGGALGSQFTQLTGIPGGALIGGILGSVVGGLFKKSKFGGASIGGIEGSLGVTGTVGNSGAAKRGGSEAADTVIGQVERIADQLNATVDASRGFVTVGSYNGKARVNTQGTKLGGSKSPVAGLKDFGDDTDAAIRYAVMDLVNDGVLVGLRAGTQRLLQNAKDLETGLGDALKFESVFTRLKAYRDPVGAAMDVLDQEFTRLNTIFGKAGASAAEYADLEALYGIERAKVIKEEGERITATLRGLLNDLTVGNDARSLRNRLAEAQANYDPLKARVEAGDRTAYDEFAAAARTMLDLQRQIYGSSSSYFDSLDTVTALTRKRIEGETNLVALTDGRDSPFTASGAAKGETVAAIEGQTSALLNGIDQLRGDLNAGLSDLRGEVRSLSVVGGGQGGGRDFRPSIAQRAF